MSLETAIKDLRKNKSSPPDLFRKLLHSPKLKYKDVHEVLNQVEKDLNAKILADPQHTLKYLKVLVILLEYEPHRQHLHINDWEYIAKLFIKAYDLIVNQLSGHTQVKACYEVMRGMQLLVSQRESLCANLVPEIVDICIDFVDRSSYKENSCFSFVMRIAYELAVMGFPGGLELGRIVFQVDRVRDSNLKYEMLLFACIDPQPKTCLLNLNLSIIQPEEVEFEHFEPLELPLKPSCEADLVNFVSAIALSRSTASEPSRKRIKGDDTLSTISKCFNQNYVDGDALEEAKSPSVNPFWALTLLAMRTHKLHKTEKLAAWNLAIENLNVDKVSSAACFCLSKLVSQLKSPELMCDEVLSKFRFLLSVLKNNEYPKLSSGSLKLIWEIQNCKILDYNFQVKAQTALATWFAKQVAKPNDSPFLSSLFAEKFFPVFLQQQVYRDMLESHKFYNHQLAMQSGDPSFLIVPDAPPAACLSNFANKIDVTTMPKHDTRSVIFVVAICALQGCVLDHAVLSFRGEFITEFDFRALVWFANCAVYFNWPAVYCDAVLNLCEWPDTIDSVNTALSMLAVPQSLVSVALSGTFGKYEPPVSNLRELQPLLQSYTLQMNPRLLVNIVNLVYYYKMEDSEDAQKLLKFLTSTCLTQSRFSRLIQPLTQTKTCHLGDLIGHCGYMPLYTLPSKGMYGLDFQSLLRFENQQTLQVALLALISHKVIGFTTALLYTIDQQLQISDIFDQWARVLEICEREQFMQSISIAITLLQPTNYEYYLNSLLEGELISKQYYSSLKGFVGRKNGWVQSYPELFSKCSLILSDEEINSVLMAAIQCERQIPSCEDSCGLAMQAFAQPVPALTNLKRVYLQTAKKNALSTNLLALYTAKCDITEQELQLSPQLSVLSKSSAEELLGIADEYFAVSSHEDNQLSDEEPQFESYNFSYFFFHTLESELTDVTFKEMREICKFRLSNETVRAIFMWSDSLGLESKPWKHFLGNLLFAYEYKFAPIKFNDYEQAVEHVYSSLPAAKKWLVKPTSTQLLNNLSLANWSIRPLSTYLSSEVCDFCCQVAKLCGKPNFSEYVIQLVPELVKYVVPLLVARKVSEKHPDQSSYDYLRTLIVSGLQTPELRDVCLEIIQCCLDASGKMLMDIDVVCKACLMNPKFHNLGIYLIELTWNKGELQPAHMDYLREFYSYVDDPGFANAIEDPNKSEICCSNPWDSLNLDMVTGDTLRNNRIIERGYQKAGLWNLAEQFSSSANFYDYEKTWWLEKWEFVDPPSFNCTEFQHLEYNYLICLLQGKISLPDAITSLVDVNKHFISTLSDTIATQRPTGINDIASKAREVRFSLAKDPQNLCLEVQTSFRQLVKTRESAMDAMRCSLKFQKISEEYPQIPEIGVIAQTSKAEVAWMLGNSSQAINAYKNILANESNNQYLNLSRSYCTVGEWLHQARHLSDSDIRDEYYLKAVSCAKEPDLEFVHHRFARFCDARFHDPYLESLIEDARNIRDNEKAQIIHLKRNITSGTSDRVTEKRFKEAQIRQRAAEEDICDFMYHKADLLKQCAENYLLSFIYGNVYADDVARFVVLWLENSESSISGQVDQITVGFQKLPVSKFIPFINQLTSRISADETDFQTVLKKLVVKICKEHPYHAVWQIMNIIKTSDRNAQQETVMRKKAADSILKEARLNGEPKKVRLIGTMILMANHMIHLAKMPNTSHKFSFTKQTGEFWLNELPHLRVPVPTATIDIAVNGNYDKVPFITEVSANVEVAGGISAPKILKFLHSDGSYHKMILKSGEKDDLRQDATMQQVFKVARSLLLRENPKMNIVTYNVIPLAATTGAIEFVNHTKSLNEILQPLHAEFGGPNEYTKDEARKIMHSKVDNKRSERLRTFFEVMKHTKPQMRHFWVKNFKQIDAWFSAKTAWCRSNGVMSILGYILGLGDRHSSNLLLNVSNGEVVHIDLGIAFDQGKLLHIPETVPFRLTRDMVDGMGPCGYSGMFSYAAETTLDILRREQDSIMSVLNVLKHDTLYNWRLPAHELHSSSQYESSSRKNKVDANEAEVALKGVNSKLNARLNCEATVRDLISQATDPENLALIFGGWAPFY